MIDLKGMTQKNMRTGYTRSLRYVDENGIKEGTSYKWQVFLGPSQGWTDFTEPHASHLNQALANGFSWTTLNSFNQAGGEWRYMIDLQGMTQKN